MAKLSVPDRFIVPEELFTEHISHKPYEPFWPKLTAAKPSKRIKMGAEDNTFTLLNMRSGSRGCVIANFVTPDGLRTGVGNMPDIEIYGSEGALLIGGPAAISIMLEHVFRIEAFLVFFTTAVCSAAADTLATEIGLLSSSKPRLITNLRRRVEKGVSGGVTLLGTVAGLLGAIVMALVLLALQVVNAPGVLSKVSDVQRLMIACSTGGFLGMIVDSLLGATVQEAYISKADNRLYEKPGKQGEYVLAKGVRGVNNHAVNFSSSSIAGLLGVMIYFLAASL